MSDDEKTSFVAGEDSFSASSQTRLSSNSSSSSDAHASGSDKHAPTGSPLEDVFQNDMTYFDNFYSEFFEDTRNLEGGSGNSISKKKHSITESSSVLNYLNLDLGLSFSSGPTNHIKEETENEIDDFDKSEINEQANNSNSAATDEDNDDDNNNNNNNNTITSSFSFLATSSLLSATFSAQNIKNGLPGSRYKYRKQYKCSICNEPKIRGNHVCTIMNMKKKVRVGEHDGESSNKSSSSSSANIQYAPNLEERLERVYSFLKIVLPKTPFDMVEKWVPINLTSKTTKLIYGGCFSKNLQLALSWDEYSKVFLPDLNQGLAGRVAATQESEIYEDIQMLQETEFCRLEGAKKHGLRTCVAIPLNKEVLPGSSVRSVFVFFALTTFPVNQSYITFLQDVVAGILDHNPK